MTKLRPDAAAVGGSGRPCRRAPTRPGQRGAAGCAAPYCPWAGLLQVYLEVPVQLRGSGRRQVSASALLSLSATYTSAVCEIYTSAVKKGWHSLPLTYTSAVNVYNMPGRAAESQSCDCGACWCKGGRRLSPRPACTLGSSWCRLAVSRCVAVCVPVALL